MIKNINQNRLGKAFWVWGEFSYKDSIYLNEIKDQVNALLKSPKFDIHLTLLGPFLNIDRSLINELILFGKNNFEIELKLNRYDFKEDVFESFYISLNYSNNLQCLRKNLIKISNFESDYKYSPHISLAYGDYSFSKKVNLIEKLPKVKSSITMSNISLVQVEENLNIWKVLKRFQLKHKDKYI